MDCCVFLSSCICTSTSKGYMPLTQMWSICVIIAGSLHYLTNNYEIRAMLHQCKFFSFIIPESCFKIRIDISWISYCFVTASTVIYTGTGFDYVNGGGVLLDFLIFFEEQTIFKAIINSNFALRGTANKKLKLNNSKLNTVLTRYLIYCRILCTPLVLVSYQWWILKQCNENPMLYSKSCFITTQKAFA